MEGKKKAKQLDSETEVLVVDVAEHEVERPKKADALRSGLPTKEAHQANRRDITAVSKNVIL